jgi:hypothetical protein
MLKAAAAARGSLPVQLARSLQQLLLVALAVAELQAAGTPSDSTQYAALQTLWQVRGLLQIHRLCYLLQLLSAQAALLLC